MNKGNLVKIGQQLGPRALGRAQRPHHQAELLNVGVALEERPPPQHLPQNAAHRPKVHIVAVVGRSVEQLRGPVPAGADLVGELTSPPIHLQANVDGPRLAKVRYLQDALPVNQKVRRLQVARGEVGGQQGKDEIDGGAGGADVQQVDDVRVTTTPPGAAQVLQNFDFSDHRNGHHSVADEHPLDGVLPTFGGEDLPLSGRQLFIFVHGCCVAVFARGGGVPEVEAVDGGGGVFGIEDGRLWLWRSTIGRPENEPVCPRPQVALDAVALVEALHAIQGVQLAEKRRLVVLGELKLEFPLTAAGGFGLLISEDRMLEGFTMYTFAYNTVFHDEP
ncbi:hypothetical protein TYRP_017464 [Tyrophagus putrescentiae]|nr:hypothetical protein TYRP_017464 [Tyrophagus putrescentiae]